MDKTPKRFISELESMQPISLLEWLMYMTEKSTEGESERESVMPVILAICYAIEHKRPESTLLVKMFLCASGELRQVKSGNRWNKREVKKSQRKCYQICTKILALF